MKFITFLFDRRWKDTIFVDDCSTDDTVRRVSALREKDVRIKLYHNHCNSGAAVSRNNALREARGRWIAFLDSDDLWEPTKLEKQVRFMEENGYKFSWEDLRKFRCSRHNNILT